jgi:hypothetical protein
MRVLCSQLVAVKWTDGGLAQDCLAVLKDISTSGACLQSEQPIPIKTPVRVAYGEGHFSGTVRYCVFRTVGYLLGIQFEADTRWSDARFRPQHLTDVRDMWNQRARRKRESSKR